MTDGGHRAIIAPMERMKYSLLMLLGALIWGLAFAFQSKAMTLGMLPYAYSAVRMGLAGLCLLPIVLWKKDVTLPKGKKERGRLLKVSAVLGLMLAIATNLQQLGLQYTTAAKSAFTTALYLLFVPVAGLFFGHKMRPLQWNWPGGLPCGTVLSVPEAGGFHL